MDERTKEIDLKPVNVPAAVWGKKGQVLLTASNDEVAARVNAMIQAGEIWGPLESRPSPDTKESL